MPSESPLSKILVACLTLRNSVKTGVELSHEMRINDDERIQEVIFGLLPGEILDPCMLLKRFWSALIKELI